MSSKIYLETSRMILREFTEFDRDEIRELDSDPEVMRYLSNGIPSDEKEIDRAMGIFLSLPEKYNHKFGHWVALDKETKNFIGWFHMRPLKDNPQDETLLELGYRLKKEYWGQGLATEGSLALIKKCQDEYKTKKFCAHAMLANDSSQNVMKKCGMSVWKEGLHEPFPGEDKRTIWYKLGF